MLFVIKKPEVFRHASNDSYIVFGEMIPEDMSKSSSAIASQNFQNAGFNIQNLQSQAQKAADSAITEVPAAEEDDEEVDDTGVEPKDIELVMQQANVSRSKAVKALKKNDLDIVNAIMVMLTYFVSLLSLYSCPRLIGIDIVSWWNRRLILKKSLFGLEWFSSHLVLNMHKILSEIDFL